MEIFSGDGDEDSRGMLMLRLIYPGEMESKIEY